MKTACIQAVFYDKNEVSANIHQTRHIMGGMSKSSNYNVLEEGEIVYLPILFI